VSKKIKVLIANSVGKDENGNNFILFPSRWTANVGKTKSFNFYPYELAYLSSILKKENCWDVLMVDGNFEALDWKKYFEKYKFVKPDFLVMETSSVVYEMDLKFGLAFKKKYGTKLIFCGQHPSAFAKEVMKDGVDYVCLGEYELTVLDILKGKKRSKIKGLYPNGRRELLEVDCLPFPEDDDISRINYADIGGCDYKEIEFFASRGCMMNCNFCVASQLYYKKPNWRGRKIENIVEEIKYLKNKYPEMEGIFFDEEYHNTKKSFILDLCKGIIDNGLADLKYDAMCGYWTLDKEMLEAMKRAGYYKIRIGIESVDMKTAKGIKKNINIKRLLKVLNLAKKVGMRMYGTFTFGALGSTAKSDRKTINFLSELLDKNLLYDFQTSICTPQPGTGFFDWLDKNNYLLTKDWLKYDGKTAVYEYPDYSKKEIEDNLKLAHVIYAKKELKDKGYLKLIGDEIKKSGLLGFCRKSFELGKSYFFSVRR